MKINRDELLKKLKNTEMYHMIKEHFDNETVEMMLEEILDKLC